MTEVAVENDYNQINQEVTRVVLMREESSGSGDGESLDGQKNQHADGLDVGYEGKRNLE